MAGVVRSMCNRGNRNKSDFYQTPSSMVSQFLQQEYFDKTLTVWEPACGKGAIVNVLKGGGFTEVLATDRDYDFLVQTTQVPYIITNPPFSLAMDFILQAKKLATRKFAFLLPLNYLHGKQRYDVLWNDKDYLLSSIYVFTRYPMLTEDEAVG